MELSVILLRTIFMYLFIFIVLRMMGKREIGKLSVFDLVISIMIAEIAVIVIEEPNASLWHAIAPILLLFCIQIALAFLTMKNRKLRSWFDGRPSVLISGGRLNQDEMRRQRYNLDDLMTQLRENKLTDVEEVELAVLESSGKLSVIPRDRPQAGVTAGGLVAAAPGDDPLVRKEPIEPKIRYELLPLPLIMDGQVQDDSLNQLGKTRFWLKNELQEHGVDNFKHVFFCSVDHKGKLYVDKKRPSTE